MDSAAAHGHPGALPKRVRVEVGSPAAARRIRRVLATAALIVLLPAGISFVSALFGPSNSTTGIRSVEWLRDHGAAGLVAKVESIYYSLTAPAKGGPALKALPRVGLGSSQAQRAAREGAEKTIVDRPQRIEPLLAPALPGEGIWSGTLEHESRNDPPLLVTTFRSDPAEYPRLVAGVAWINTSNTSVSLIAGRQEPSVQLPSRGAMDVPSANRGKLLATFNSGFKLSDARGGWAINGHTYSPMREGQATFVRYSDGHYDVNAWHGGPQVGSNVVFARQNLPLIVSGSKSSSKLSNTSEWGATVGNAVQVWRSGIGIDAHGNLLYAAANDQTVGSLAKILRHAGAVRAMELDINSFWISFNTYAAAGALRPAKLLAETERPATRYLTPDDRDFFAVYSR
jgi:hypothetical protein